MVKTKTTPVRFLMEFRDGQQRQAAIVGAADMSEYAAYWHGGRVRHKSIYKCIAVLEMMGYSVVTDTFIS